MAVDFSKYMNIPTGEMKRERLPVGHYFGTIKASEPKESSKNKPMLSTRITISSAAEDVNQAELPQGGVAGKTVSINHMLDQDFGRDDIRKMIEAAGVQMDPTQPWGQYLPQIIGRPVKLFVDHRRLDPQDPNSELIEDVKKILPA